MNHTTTTAIRPASVRLPFRFDTRQLLADLALVRPEEWIRHYRPDEYEGDWSIAPLRSVAGHPAVIHAVPTDAERNVYQSTPLLQRCAYFQQVLATLECPLGAVRLMSLGAGARILEHCDHLTEGEVRLHIPLVTNNGVQFWVDHQLVPMQPGELWYADFSRPHRVENNGPEARIHLVVDGLSNVWLEELLDAAAAV